MGGGSGIVALATGTCGHSLYLCRSHSAVRVVK